tara:strand:+ start:76 stop:351 length:276 start_codon:yes stop_codon:yes gene_type:complete
MTTVDIGDKCTHCAKDTSMGSGLFVNRVPSGSWGKLINDNGETLVERVYVDGYMCSDCLTVDCDECNQPIELDCEVWINDIRMCEQCVEKS